MANKILATLTLGMSPVEVIVNVPPREKNPHGKKARKAKDDSPARNRCEAQDNSSVV